MHFSKKQRLEKTSREKISKARDGGPKLQRFICYFTLCWYGKKNQRNLLVPGKLAKGYHQGYDFMLALFQDVPTQWGFVTWPVLFWKETLDLVSDHWSFHVSPTWLSSLFPHAPPCVNIVCVFLCPILECFSLSCTPVVLQSLFHAVVIPFLSLW